MATNRHERILNGLILLLIGLLGILCAWRRRPRSHPVSPPSAAPPSQAPLIYLQTDPRWADERIGGSDEAIRNVGCTLCCIAMALEHHGIHMTPAELNAKLKAADGYTGRGWVKWHAVSTVTGGAVRVEVPDEPSRERIDAALAAGSPVTAKVLLYRVTPHWVLLVGKQGDDYVIKDPLGDGTCLERLAKYSSGIQAIRVVRPAVGAW